MTLIQHLCLLLLAAHLLGRLAVRARQPELLGHLAAGVLLGPALLGWVHANPMLNSMSDMAVLFVAISAGLEMRLGEVIGFFKGRNLLALLPSILLPASSALVLALIFDYAWVEAVVVALCVAVTALPVALRILRSFGLLGSRLAQLTIAAALLADIAVLISLGALASALASGQRADIDLGAQFTMVSLKLAGFASLLFIGAAVSKQVYRRFNLQPRRWAMLEHSFSLLLILSLAVATEALGLHFVIGAFLGALMVSEYHSQAQTPHPLREQLEGGTQWVFAPLFLASQGTHFVTQSFSQGAFVLLLVTVAVASKLLGGYYSARWLGLARHEAHGAAIVMNARGLMEMVVASIAYRAGLVSETLYSILLVVGMVTTLVTPLLLQYWQTRSQMAITKDKSLGRP